MKRLATIPLAGLLLLAPAVPAAADHDERRERRVERHERYERGDRYERRHDPRRHDHDHSRCALGLQQRATEIERLTDRILKRARRNNPYPTWTERRALRSLRKLEREAADFRHATREARRVQHVARDFEALEHSFHRAAHRFERLDANRKLRREFRELAHAVKRTEHDLRALQRTHRRPQRVAWR